MKKILIFPALIVFFSLLFSCNDLFDDGLDSFPDTGFGAAMLYPSGNTKTDKIQRYIFAHHPATRAEGPVSLTPYLRGEDTVLLIANYGSGWDIFGYDERGPMVIASSESGEFLLTDTANYPSNFVGYIDATADQLHELMAEASDSVQPYGLWNLYVHFEPGKNDSLKVDDPRDTTRTKEELGNILEIHEVEILNDINWHQRSPWNRYLMVDELQKKSIDDQYQYLISLAESSDTWEEKQFWIEKATHDRDSAYEANRCLVGCAPLAVGMFLYAYHHNVHKYPIQVPAKGDFDATTNTVIFSGETKTLWEHMNSTDSATVDSIAIYLGNLSAKICHQFSKDSTSASYVEIRDYLNNANLPHRFNMTLYNYEDIKNSIDDDTPIYGIVNGQNETSVMGHAFLYRGCRKREERLVQTGKFDPIHIVVQEIAMKWGQNYNGTSGTDWDNVWFDASDAAEWNWAGYTITDVKYYLKMTPR